MTPTTQTVFVETPDGETAFNYDASEGHIPQIGETIRLSDHTGGEYSPGERWNVSDIETEYRKRDSPTGGMSMCQYIYVKVGKADD